MAEDDFGDTITTTTTTTATTVDNVVGDDDDVDNGIDNAGLDFSQLEEYINQVDDHHHNHQQNENNLYVDYFTRSIISDNFLLLLDP